MGDKISTMEPADRPLTVTLSKAEVLALANYHVGECKRITRLVGKKLTTMAPGQFFPPSAAYSKGLIKVAREQIKAHANRSKGLQSLLKS